MIKMFYLLRRRKMKIATVVMLMLFLMLAACTGILLTPSAAPETGSPASQAALPSAPSKAQTEMGTGAAILLTRSGGFSGKTEQWIVYADGRITNNSVDIAQVSPEQLAALLQSIDDLGFYNLQSSYMPLDTCCDRFTYELSVTNGEKSNQVTFLEGTPNLPSGLLQAAGAVNQLVTAGTK
jgi:hypothetical protein